MRLMFSSTSCFFKWLSRVFSTDITEAPWYIIDHDFIRNSSIIDIHHAHGPWPLKRIDGSPRQTDYWGNFYGHQDQYIDQ